MLIMTRNATVVLLPVLVVALCIDESVSFLNHPVGRCCSDSYRGGQVSSFVRIQQQQFRCHTTTTSSTATALMMQAQNYNANKRNKFSSNRNSNSNDNKNTRQQPQQHGPNKQELIADFNRHLQSMLKTDPSRADEAEQELLKKLQSNNYDTNYDVVSFNIVLQAWGKQQNAFAADRADALLQTLKSLKQIQPDTYSYAAVLNAYAKSKGGRKAALRAQHLVEEMEASSPQHLAITNDICHNTLMNTWAGQPDGGEKCNTILEHLEQKSLASLISYNACIKAWMRTKDAQRAGPEAHKILDKLKLLSQTNARLAPDKVTYTSTINAWVSHQDPMRASQKADALLREMEQLSLTQAEKGPDIIAYTTVLTAMAKAGDPNAAKDILQRMDKYGKEPPNVHFCNALIHLFAKSNTDGGTAESVLRSMEMQGLQPDKITYSAVISTYANHGDATKAVQLLDELQGKWEQSGRKEMFLPNSQIFLSVLNALRNSQAPDALDKAFQLLGRLKALYEANQHDPNLEPNRIIYSQFFQIICHSNDAERAAKLATDILEDMKMMHQLGYANVEPDATIYAYVVNTLTKSGSIHAAEQAFDILTQVEARFAETGSPAFQPTSLLYSAVLQAYAKSSTPDGAQKAETLLRRNLKWFAAGKKFAQPTIQCYNAVIDAHARSGDIDAAKKAEAVLVELESSSIAKPNTRSYNAVILALKNSGASPALAESVLKRMSNRYKNGDITCRPDRVSINSIIALLAKHGMASRALEFMKFMELSFEEHGDVTLKPDLFTYNSVLDAIGRSGWDDAGPRANELYQRMIQNSTSDGESSGTKPDAVTFASLRHAWSKTKGGQDEADRMHQAMVDAKARQQHLQASTMVVGNTILE